MTATIDEYAQKLDASSREVKVLQDDLTTEDLKKKEQERVCLVIVQFILSSNCKRV